MSAIVNILHVIGRITFGIILALNVFCVIQGFVRSKDDLVPYAIGTGIIIYIGGLIYISLYVAGM